MGHGVRRIAQRAGIEQLVLPIRGGEERFRKGRRFRALEVRSLNDLLGFKLEKLICRWQSVKEGRGGKEDSERDATWFSREIHGRGSSQTFIERVFFLKKCIESIISGQAG